MLMGYLVVSAVLVVTLGRLGDIHGRVRMYNLGFTIFARGAPALPFAPLKGPGGALWLIGFRVVQATGGAMLMANSPAILTDAFPSGQRGMAMGINQVAGISGTFIGLILGGIGILFSLMIAGLSSTLPVTLTRRLMSQGVPAAIAHQVGQTPPVAGLFATVLGYNPVHELLAPSGILAHLPAQCRRADREAVLPAPHLRAVPSRAGDRVRHGLGRAGHRGRRRGRASRQAARPGPGGEAAPGPVVIST